MGARRHGAHDTYTAKAQRLYERFNEDFWLDEHGWYALGLDADKQPIDVLASNMGHCLWTGIVDPEKAPLVVERLMSPEMFSGWGIRTLATKMTGFNPVRYHNGSVWPHDNALIAAGLMRYGFVDEAQRVIKAQLDVAAVYDGRSRRSSPGSNVVAPRPGQLPDVVFAPGLGGGRAAAVAAHAVAPRPVGAARRAAGRPRAARLAAAARGARRRDGGETVTFTVEVGLCRSRAPGTSAWSTRHGCRCGLGSDQPPHARSGPETRHGRLEDPLVARHHRARQEVLDHVLAADALARCPRRRQRRPPSGGSCAEGSVHPVDHDLGRCTERALITGVPHARASARTSPNGSGQLMGHSAARARLSTSTLTWWGGCSMTVMSSSRRGSTTRSQYSHSSGSERFTIMVRGRPAVWATSTAVSVPSPVDAADEHEEVLFVIAERVGL